MKEAFNKIIGGLLTAAVILTASGCTENIPNDDKENTDTSSSTNAPASTDSPGNNNGSTAAKEVDAGDAFKGNMEDVTLKKGDTYAVFKIKDFGEIKCKLFPEAAPVGVKSFIDTANSGYYTDKTIHRVVKNFMLQGGSFDGEGHSSADEPKFGVEYNKNMRHFYGALCYANAGGVNGTQFFIINNKECGEFTDASLYESYIKKCDSYITQAKALIETSTGTELEEYKAALAYYENLKNMYQIYLKATNDITDEVKERYKEKGGYPFLDGGYTVFGQVVEGFDVVDKISAVEVTLNSGNENSKPVTDIVIESVTVGTVE